MLARLFLAALLLSTFCSAQSADTVLVHGKVWTGNPQQPEAEAIALLGDRVLAVGASADIAKLAGANTRTIELNGRRVVPGFNDAHTHLFQGGLALAGPDLRNTRSQTEMRDRLAAYAKTRAKGEWILNGNWDHESWTPAVMPSAALTDPVTPNNPVLIDRLDGHTVLANSTAMQLAGITRATPDVPGGVILRDKDGNPTGIFQDAAIMLIRRVIPPPNDQQLDQALRAAEQYAAQHGVTSVSIMWEGEPTAFVASELRVLQRAEASGQLSLRVAMYTGLPYWKIPAAAGIMHGFGDDWVHIGGLKDFADGSLGSGTAWLLAPYSDAPNSSGVPRPRLTAPDGIYADAKAADAAGLQIAIHAIGDRSNREVLNIYQRIAQENGPGQNSNPAGRRFRIEHAQHLTAQDIPRFGQLHVIASMQPIHLEDDARWAEKRIGPERARFAYAFRSLLDSGAVLAFGSDWPVAAMDPIEGIATAVTRRAVNGQYPQGWTPREKITAAEALRAFTWGSAYAEFRETRKGTLAPGMLADLVILDRDILTIPPDQLHTTQVDMTILAGKTIYTHAK